MTTLQVALSGREYPIFIDDQLDPVQCLIPYVAGKQVMLVSNVTVAPLYLALYHEALVRGGKQVASCILPDGERYKTHENLNAIYDALLSAGFNRDCTIVALGGGVIGDMAGFAAATYQRGVAFIQIPTTLLAQVDSSVGGKTGINHPLGKNMIGAFKQPRAVLASMNHLSTLPPRELSAGLAEVIKYALIRDEAFLVWLETHMESLSGGDSVLLAEAVARSCAHKAAIVAADEEERGERALLNLGHTFGHVIETYMGYGEWLHGEAVAAGTMLAADLSRRLGWISAADQQRIADILKRAGLPVLGPSIPVNEALKLMGHDKKVLAGKLRFILLKGVGQGVIASDIPDELLAETLRAGLSGPGRPEECSSKPFNSAAMNPLTGDTEYGS